MAPVPSLLTSSNLSHAWLNNSSSDVSFSFLAEFKIPPPRAEWKERTAANSLQLNQEAKSKKAVINNNSLNAPKQSKVLNVIKGSSKDTGREELQKQQKVFAQLEKKLAQLQQQKLDIETSLVSHEVYSDTHKFKSVESNYQQLLKQVDETNTQYEQIFEKILLQEQGKNP